MATARLTFPFVGSLAGAVLAGACGDSPEPSAPRAPVVVSAVVTANPHNALSAVVSVTLRESDSVAVRYRLTDLAAAIDSVTPAVVAGGGRADVAVLGLLPATRYSLRAVAYGPGGASEGATMELTTPPLPADLPHYTAGGPDPSPGYVVFAAGSYGVVIDNTGRVVWYHRFPIGLGLSFAAHTMGRYVARLVTPSPADIEPWVELDPLGNTTRTLGCARDLQARFHDLLVEPDGGFWIMCDESRTMDLAPFGGPPRARVTGTVVQHLSATGALLFDWSPFDHFAITDVDPGERADSVVNWTHGNSLDIDTDGNLLVSFRNLNEITKIDVTTGRVVWRFGGRRNQFALLDTPTPPFAHQHSVRAAGPGSILLLDNIGNPLQSGAERYELDERAMTARLAQAYTAAPGVVTQIGGSTQALPGGRTLVSFGTAGRVEEYDATGRVVWRVIGNAGYVFRAQRIGSLYTPGLDAPR